MRLWDTHAHLNHPKLLPRWEELLSRVDAACVVGWDIPSSELAVDLAKRSGGKLKAVVGVHPHDAKSLSPAELKALEEFAREPEVVAIGEIGLDFYRDLSPREAQERAFREQLALAMELGLPAVLHVRKAYPEVIKILEEVNPPRVLFHLFSGNKSQALWALERGYFISSGPPSKTIKSLVRQRGLSQIVVETDSPYVLPEPGSVRVVVEKLAKYTGQEPEEVAERTFENAQKFFSRP